MAAGVLAACVAAGCGSTTTTTGPGTNSAKKTSSGAPAPKVLKLTASDTQTVKQGDTDKIQVSVNRDNFDEAVSLGFEDLPKGVTLVENNPVIAKGDKMMSLTLKAADDAAVGDHDIVLVAKADGVDKNNHKIKLTVKAK